MQKGKLHVRCGRVFWGFSLVEMLGVLAILGVLCGALLLLPLSSWLLPSAEGSVREAERLQRWLMHNMVRAIQDRRNFTFFAPLTTPQESVLVMWPGVAQGERKDVSKGYSYRVRSLVAGKSIFSWLHHTMTPAMTIEVRHSDNIADPPDVFVVISGYGSVSVRKTPP